MLEEVLIPSQEMKLEDDFVNKKVYSISYVEKGWK